jgi:hypothetical protein
MEGLGRILEHLAVDAIFIRLALEDVVSGTNVGIRLGSIEGASVGVANPGGKP